MSALLKPQPVPPRIFTWTEYEHEDAQSDAKIEFANGQLYAMAGATSNHNRISLNVASELRQGLKGKSCEAFVSDMKLRIDLGYDEIGYYPDVMVICDPQDNHAKHRTNPKVIIEVLSKSTLRIDKGEKLLAYQAIPGLEAYVMLHQEAKRAVVHRRSNQWWPEILEGDDAVLTLDEIGIQIHFRDIYDRVDWSEVEP
ncbi:MAG: Uma2 family endonuclease [Prosthecobacter sp.]